MMRLRILLPTEQLLDRSIRKFFGDGENGLFCLLPRHIDFVTALRAGVSSMIDADGEEQFFGHSSGLLVKSATDLRVVVANGVLGDDLQELQQVVAQHFTMTDERERQAISTIARLEADFVRRYLDLEAVPNG